MAVLKNPSTFVGGAADIFPSVKESALISASFTIMLENLSFDLDTFSKSPATPRGLFFSSEDGVLPPSIAAKRCFRLSVSANETDSSFSSSATSRSRGARQNL